MTDNITGHIRRDILLCKEQALFAGDLVTFRSLSVREVHLIIVC